MGEIIYILRFYDEDCEETLNNMSRTFNSVIYEYLMTLQIDIRKDTHINFYSALHSKDESKLIIYDLLFKKIEISWSNFIQEKLNKEKLHNNEGYEPIISNLENRWDVQFENSLLLFDPKKSSETEKTIEEIVENNKLKFGVLESLYRDMGAYKKKEKVLKNNELKLGLLEEIDKDMDSFYYRKEKLNLLRMNILLF